MSTKKFVKLLSSIFVALIATIGFSTASAYAASAHYVKGPTATVSGNSLIVSWKAAGLGNTVESAQFHLTGDVYVTSQCYTKSGNPVNGVPKTDTLQVDATDTFPVRNGQVTGQFVIEPLSTLQCTGTQKPRILSVDYSNLVLSADGFPSLYYEF